MSTMRQWVIRYDNSKSFNEESILTKHIKKIFKRSRKIDEILDTFNIERSLSRKGNPYDNAVSEATNKILKIEFIYQNNFDTLEELELQLAEYIYWYNYIRIHGSLGYITPIEYRNKIGLEMVA